MALAGSDLGGSPSKVPADGIKAARVDAQELVIRYGYLLVGNHQHDRLYRLDRRDGSLRG
ncbi:MAG: hypothetical protein KC910_23735 [Candidatus Eremiobacteraeota bacterium]|nr:hypothetical protein [Candidatus Eremiobacteraeota bacterium]